ncbi:unnamed protein product [Hyaloperonospora brassicae]|uniref:Uncharacterized protein n=1 Tax=Hyaloperonospora brassicae TaxID=162125 RepID=A0AAV0UTA3_HYABA|nr:unnamed protein product [Hyaloperonospora brassicae]
MASIFSAGQSISSIGKSMTAIACVKDHLATFMKKVIYHEKFFQRMGPNLPVCVVNAAALLFQRCYEYRDEIRDELESSVAYVADAGRWVVGMGDWNSKMEKRLSQISELVLLANTLLAEYAVTGEVGAKGCRDELVAYLQLLTATVTLKNAHANVGDEKLVAAMDGRLPRAGAQSVTAAEFSSEISALGSEISGAFSEMFGINGVEKPVGSDRTGQTFAPHAFDTDDDARNPFAASFQRPFDPSCNGTGSGNASVASSIQSRFDTASAGTSAAPDCPLSDRDTLEGPLSPVSMGEYECLDLRAIPKYAAFKSSAQRAARHKYAYGNGSFTAGMTSDGEQSMHSDLSTEYNELFPSAPVSTQAVSRSLSVVDTNADLKKKRMEKPMMDTTYSYDVQCEVAHNPFLSPSAPGPIMPHLEKDCSRTTQHELSLQEQQPTQSAGATSKTMPALSPLAPTVVTSETNTGQTHVPDPLSAAPMASSVFRSAPAPPPMLQEAVDQVPVCTASPCAQNGSTQRSSRNSVQGLVRNVDETNAQTAAPTAEHDHEHELCSSDQECDLFGIYQS